MASVRAERFLGSSDYFLMLLLWTHRLTTALAVSIIALMAVSGFIVSDRTGLPIPAWAEGGQMPHRLLAGVVALLAVAVCVFCLRSPAWAWGKRLSVVALCVVLTQAGLGMALARAGGSAALGVLQSMLMHTLVMVVGILLLLSSRAYAASEETVEDELRPSLRTMAWWPVILVVVQIALGAAYRHGLLGVIPHLLGAFVVAGALTFLAILVAATYPRHKALKRIAFLVVWLTVSQIVLGLIALVYRVQASTDGEIASWWVLFTVAHIILGSLTLAATARLALQIRKFVGPATTELVPATVTPAAELGTKLG